MTGSVSNNFCIKSVWESHVHWVFVISDLLWERSLRLLDNVSQADTSRVHCLSQYCQIVTVPLAPHRHNAECNTVAAFCHSITTSPSERSLPDVTVPFVRRRSVRPSRVFIEKPWQARRTGAQPAVVQPDIPVWRPARHEINFCSANWSIAFDAIHSEPGPSMRPASGQGAAEPSRAGPGRPMDVTGIHMRLDTHTATTGPTAARTAQRGRPWNPIRSSN